jgi:hypothetical protein
MALPLAHPNGRLVEKLETAYPAAETGRAIGKG